MTTSMNMRRNESIGLEDYNESTAAETCCVDVWENVMNSSKVYPLSRICTDQEKHKISLRKVIFKQCLSIIMLGLIAWFVSIRLNEKDNNIGVIFDCSPDSETGIIAADEVFDLFEDHGISYCWFKSVMIVLSFIFLIPFLLEAFSLVTIVWISTINDEVLIPVADGQYAGYDSIFNMVMSPNPLYRFFVSFTVLFYVPQFVLYSSTDREGFNFWKQLMLVVELLWKLVVFMVPDILLTLSLFPVSYYVMQSSNSPDEIIVNLVAVQVFAVLSETFVKMLLRPRSSVGEHIQNYLNDNPKSSRAKYSPLEAYNLATNRHEWGVKVNGKKEMKELHGYEGFHFSP